MHPSSGCSAPRIEASLPPTCRSSEQTLDQLGKKIEIKIYDDAGHAFENPNNKEGYREADAADAWKRTVEFLASTLKK